MTISTLSHKSIANIFSNDIDSLHDEFIWVRLLNIDMDVKIDSDDIRAECGIYPYLENILRNADATDEVIEYAVEEVTNHDYILVDWEGQLTSLCCNQYGFDEELFEQLLDATENYEEEVVVACYELFSSVDDNYLELYLGEYDSDLAFAWQYIDDTGMFADVPESISRYFDIEAFARDMMINDITSHNGHYFYNH